MRLVDRVWQQIPVRLHGRFDVSVISDPYYLRTEVIVTDKNGAMWPSGPIEVTTKRGKFIDCKLPDWFVAHICSIPVDDNSLNAQLWDSLNIEEEQRRMEEAWGPPPYDR